MITTAIKCIPSKGRDDWYVIEHAQHAHKFGLQQMEPGVMALTWTGRICDADVEGDASEMLAIAEAIESRKSIGFGRCAVAADDPVQVVFWSPRNSQVMGIVSRAVADDLARQIRNDVRA